MKMPDEAGRVGAARRRGLLGRERAGESHDEKESHRGVKRRFQTAVHGDLLGRGGMAVIAEFAIHGWQVRIIKKRRDLFNGSYEKRRIIYGA
jgi:hypothetical protein